MTKKLRENRVPIMMSAEEIAAIDDWRFANRVATRSDAIRRLAQAGMVTDRYLADVAAHYLAVASEVVSTKNKVRSYLDEKPSKGFTVEDALETSSYVVESFAKIDRGSYVAFQFLSSFIREMSALGSSESIEEGLEKLQSRRNEADISIGSLRNQPNALEIINRITSEFSKADDE